jgi:YHS domain-containing protein
MKPTAISKLVLTIVAASIAFAVSDLRADTNVPKNYPLKTCPVSGDKLGEHGKSVKATAPDGTVVYLCCRDCMKDFKKDPEKYAKMVKAAAKK